MQDRNTLLLAFLAGCTRVEPTSTDKRKLKSLTHAVEQIIHVRNLNAITPFAFQRNLISYSVTQSKTAVQLQGAWESSGGYSTIHKFLLSPAPPLTCPFVDVHNTFDNNQKVGKHSGRIYEGSKVPVSVCTTVGHITTPYESFMQFDDSLHPKLWLNTMPLDAILKEVERLEALYKYEFRMYRGGYINEVIQHVIQETKSSEIGDYVDVMLKNEQFDVCVQCCHVYPKECSASLLSDKICPKCSYNASHYELSYDPYFRTPHRHADGFSTMHIGEPLMENPNSYKSVRKVVNHIRNLCDVGNTRKWTMISCDGVPYYFAAKIQDELVICEKCFDEINKSDIEKHASTHNNEDVEFQKAFNDILIRPGPGHIEMNMAKVLLKLCWIPFLNEVVKRLGFRSLKAQDVVKNGVDHHRSKQILEASLEAMSRELILPYVKNCKDKKGTPSCEGFHKWMESQVDNDLYFFLYDVTFTYLLAFHLFTEAVRKNNSTRMMAARVAFGPLFYGSHHPKYQLLLLRDMCQRAQYPEKIKNHVEETESFTLTGSKNTGQGADFIHEEVPNRLVKSFLSPGMPTETTWARLCRKAKDLREMKNKCLESSGFSVNQSKRKVKLDSEIAMIRRLVRKENFVCINAQSNLMGLDKTPLDSGIANFKAGCEKNYVEYKASLLETGLYGKAKFTPISVMES